MKLLLLVLALLIAGCRFGASNLPLPTFPRVAMYGNIQGNGRPFINSDGSLDSANIVLQARYDVVVLDASPISDRRPDVLEEMRRLNPKMIALAFVIATTWPASDPLILPWKLGEAVRSTNGTLYRLDGKEHWPNINMANPATVEAFADTLIRNVMLTGVWDGMFVDACCLSVDDGTVDFKRAGYATLPEFNAAWREGHRAFATRLRQAAPFGFILIGNCGPSGERDLWNGWMRENFPKQNCGTWEGNMISCWGDSGYLADDHLYVNPSFMWLSTQAPAPYGYPVGAEACRRERYGLASATLAGGVHSMQRTTDPLRGFYPIWWDEFSVNTKGVATGDASAKGWLGKPLGPAVLSRMGFWFREFQFGLVIVNPTPYPIRLPLSEVYWRISGTVCPSVNDGQPANGYVIPGNDGMFFVVRR